MVSWATPRLPDRLLARLWLLPIPTAGACHQKGLAHSLCIGTCCLSPHACSTPFSPFSKTPQS